MGKMRVLRFKEQGSAGKAKYAYKTVTLLSQQLNFYDSVSSSIEW